MIIKEHTITVDESNKCVLDKPITLTRGDRDVYLLLTIKHQIKFNETHFLPVDMVNEENLFSNEIARMDLLATVEGKVFELVKDLRVENNMAQIEIKERFLDELVKPGTIEMRMVVKGEDDCSIVLQPFTATVLKPLADEENIYKFTENRFGLFPLVKQVKRIESQDGVLNLESERHQRTTIEANNLETIKINVPNAICDEIHLTICITNAIYDINLQFSENVIVNTLPVSVLDGEYEFIFTKINTSEWSVIGCKIIEK